MRHRIVLENLNPVDDEAVERAASHPVFDELLEQLTTDEPGAAPGPTTGMAPLLRPRPRHRSRLALAAAAMVIVGVVAVVTLLGSASGLHGSLTTPVQAARPFASAPSTHPAKSGTWRLLDAHLTGTWQQDVDGPPSGHLTCPTPHVCYTMSGHYPSAAANAPLLSESLYVSADAAARWSVLPMPNGFAPTTALLCATATWCAAGGTYQGLPVLAITADGGHSFTLQPLPSGPGTLRALSCPTTQFCGGLVVVGTSGLTRSVTGPPPDAHATFFAITEGGQAFADEPIGSGESMVALACTSFLDCIAVGAPGTTAGRPGGTGVGAVTTDGGRSWQPSTFPTGFGLDLYAQLSCTDTDHCMVLGTVPVTVANPPQCASVPHQPGPISSPSSPPPMSPSVSAISSFESQLLAQANVQEANSGNGFSCSHGSTWTAVSDVAVTINGGHTWTPEPLPSNVPNPQLMGVACSSATVCWVTGQEEVPQTVGTGHDQGSSVLIGTTDGGATWERVTFTTPATAPNPTGQSYLSIAFISCPSASVCVAGGATAAGASTAPLYRLVIPES